MRRNIGPRLTAAATVTVALIALASCAPAVFLDPDASTSLGDRTDWVILVAMAADNELEAQAIEDLNEMEAAGLDGSGVTLLALVDRAPGHDSSNGNWVGTRLYRIVDDPAGVDRTVRSLPLAVPELGLDPAAGDVKRSLADPATLEGALRFVRRVFDPRRLGLIIWGHGSGYRSIPAARATSFDDSTGDALYTAELAAAIAGAGVDVIGFDTCFAATIEVAYELAGTARYLVASQGLIPADGFEYDDLFRRFLATDRSPRALALCMTESAGRAWSRSAGSTIAAVDLDRVHEIVGALDAVSDALSQRVIDRRTRDAVRELLFYDVEAFYATPGDLSIDLADLARVATARLAEGAADPLVDAAAALEEAVDRAVIAIRRGAARDRASGLSVHLIPLGPDGTALSTHDPSYLRGEAVRHPLRFVAESAWPPAPSSGTGLLYRLFYEVIE